MSNPIWLPNYQFLIYASNRMIDTCKACYLEWIYKIYLKISINLNNDNRLVDCKSVSNQYLNFFILKQNLLFVWRNVKFAFNVHLYIDHWHERIIWYLSSISIQDSDIQDFFSWTLWYLRCVNCFIFAKHFIQNGFKPLNCWAVWCDGNRTIRVWTFLLPLTKINNTLKKDMLIQISGQKSLVV